MAEQNQLQVILDEQNVAKDNAQALIKAFGAPFDEAGAILAEYESIVVTDEDQFDLMAEARSKRLALKNIRVGVENKRKELKEDSLRTGRAIDSVAKFIKDAIEPAEKHLELQEKYGEIKLAERKAKIKAERIEKLMKYTNDISVYNLDDMTDEAFETLLSQLKAAADAEAERIAKEEADRAAAEKAKAEDDERIRQENARLKREADEREASLEKEREAERKKQAAIDAENEKKLEAERKKADEEREKREALEAEQRAEKDRIAKEQAEADESKRKALLAPDKDKLLAFADQIDAIQPPNVSNRDAGKVLDETKDFLERISKNLRKKAKEL